MSFFFTFELGGITKHLMTGPTGNSDFRFPLTSMFLLALLRRTLRVSGTQNSLCPVGQVLIILFHLTHEFLKNHHVPLACDALVADAFNSSSFLSIS